MLNGHLVDNSTVKGLSAACVSRSCYNSNHLTKILIKINVESRVLFLIRPNFKLLKVLLLLKILEETKALNLAVSPSSLATERLSSLPGDQILELWLNSIQVLEVSWSSLESIFGKSLDNLPSDVQILEVWLLIKVLKVLESKRILSSWIIIWMPIKAIILNTTARRSGSTHFVKSFL